MRINIRPIKTEDIIAVSEIICSTLRNVNKKDYTEEEIDRLVSIFQPEEIKKLIYKRFIFVAENEKEILGTASLGLFGKKEDNNWTVYTVFVKPKLHKLGIGKMLMDRVEDLARQKGVDKLTVPSSITAFSFYKKLGYEQVEYIENNKVYIMTKKI